MRLNRKRWVKTGCGFVLCALAAGAAFAGQGFRSAAAADGGGRSPALALVAEAIAHHDPDDLWPDALLLADLQEERPDGTVRVSRLEIDNRSGDFRVSGRHEIGGEGGRLSVAVTSEGCRFAIDGRDPTPAESEERRLTCERWRSMRDYYVYLWGLPMKLRDPGTRIAPAVERTEFLGREADAIRVTYDASVGDDTWLLYFDPKTRRLLGSRFFHEEAANDGEYLLHEGETRAGSMSLTRTLSWYVNADDTFLGKDTLAGALLKSR